MLINFPKIPRFVVTFMPALQILTMMPLFIWLGGPKRWDIERWTLVALVGASLIWAGPVLFGRYASFNPLMSSQLKTAPAVNAISAWVDEHLPDDEKFLIVNYFELVNMESLAWSMVADGDWPSIPFSHAEADGLLVGEPTAENIDRFRQDVDESGANFVVVIEGSDWGQSWPPFGEQTEEQLTFLTAEEFQVEVVNRPEEILWTTMLDQSIAEQILQNERGTFNLKLILYRVNGS